MTGVAWQHACWATCQFPSDWSIWNINLTLVCNWLKINITMSHYEIVVSLSFLTTSVYTDHSNVTRTTRQRLSSVDGPLDDPRFSTSDSTVPYDQETKPTRHNPDPWSLIPSDKLSLLVITHNAGSLFYYWTCVKTETKPDWGSYIRCPRCYTLWTRSTSRTWTQTSATLEYEDEWMNGMHSTSPHPSPKRRKTVSRYSEIIIPI